MSKNHTLNWNGVSALTPYQLFGTRDPLTTASKTFKRSKNSFVLYKKIYVIVKTSDGRDRKVQAIARLYVKSAKRVMNTRNDSNTFGQNKLRVSSAKVMSITDFKGTRHETGFSCFDKSFKYVVGKKVKCLKKFDDREYISCGSGIHGYLSLTTAKRHRF